MNQGDFHRLPKPGRSLLAYLLPPIAAIARVTLRSGAVPLASTVLNHRQLVAPSLRVVLAPKLVAPEACGGVAPDLGANDRLADRGMEVGSGFSLLATA